jgi:16S rRNA (cytosine967-C5)-methyltransferase
VDLGSALARARAPLKDERDRALAGEIATGTLRWQGAFDHIIGAFANRPLRKLDPEVLDVLRLTIFQLLHLDRIPASAAVKDAVDLVGKAGKRSAAGMVNAILRRVSREREHLPLPPRPADAGDRAAALSYLSVTLSHPEWLVARWLDRYGFEGAEQWARFNNSPAALTLRANPLKTTRDALQAALASAGIDVEAGAHNPDALIVRAGNPLTTFLDEQGLFVVQDEASQLVAQFADAQPGELVLDACASPGGKTTALAFGVRSRFSSGGPVAPAAGKSRSDPEGRVVAADVRGRRIELLARTVRRSGAGNVRIVQADAMQPLPFGPVFDRVLLDAPCSGLGTLRRDPDIKWRRREEDLPALAAAQLAMAGHAASVLAPGGALVYATCSSEPEENDGVVDAFLASHPDFEEARPRLRTRPDRDRLEAFFAAMLVKTKDLR